MKDLVIDSILDHGFLTIIFKDQHFVTSCCTFYFQGLWFPFKSVKITKAGKFQVVNFIDRGILCLLNFAFQGSFQNYQLFDVKNQDVKKENQILTFFYSSRLTWR